MNKVCEAIFVDSGGDFFKNGSFNQTAWIE